MKYDLSIVIVNYNVRHFLEQTLSSIESAKSHLNIVTWVVDNNSVDDSIDMVKSEFPTVNLIENKENVGFSKANNQAIKKSNAKYILLLNPDTVLQEDTLIKCFDYMESNPNAGALGVKMIDGSGQFLPESKRGFPSPWVSFCKSTGLSTLFPKSKTFNHYHLGYLSAEETHSIDVLCGAFMFLRSEVLDKVGLLDESFFMYGEDIDLSYRIKDAGHDVIYYPATKIIHFKGESTKKGSLNYVRVFYQAMIIFANKHYSGKGAGLFSFFLRAAIIARGSLSMLKRVAKRIGPAILDMGFAVLSYWGVSQLWERFYFNDPEYFTQRIWYNIIMYAAINVFVFGFQNVYSSKIKIGSLVRGVLLSLVISLAIYGLLNNNFRNSRAILVLGTIAFGVLAIAWRLLRSFLKNKTFNLSDDETKNIAIIGSKKESLRVKKLLSKSLINHQIAAYISDEGGYDNSIHTGKLHQLAEIISIEKIDEIIFSIKDMKWKDVMNIMATIGPKVQYKMIGDEQISILGSQSKNEAGELYTVDFQYNINKAYNRFLKRIVDIILSLVLLLFSFLLIFFQKNKQKYFQNIFNVLFGKNTWVGYHQLGKNIHNLPTLKPGIIDRTYFFDKNLDKEMIERVNILYAKDYYPWMDVETILKSLNKLGE